MEPVTHDNNRTLSVRCDSNKVRQVETQTHGWDHAAFLHAWKSTTHITLLQHNALHAAADAGTVGYRCAAHLKPHQTSRAVRRSPLDQKPPGGLCVEVIFSRSKQLRQNYGCLTPRCSPKLCLCGRWSHPYLLWVVSLGRGQGHGAFAVHQLVWPLCSKYLSGGEPPHPPHPTLPL